MTEFARRLSGDSLGVTSTVTEELARNGLLRDAYGLWAAEMPVVRKDLGNDVFKAWIEPLRIVSADACVVTLGAPNAFAASRVTTEHLHRLQARWTAKSGDANGIAQRLQVIVAPLDQDGSRSSAHWDAQTSMAQTDSSASNEPTAEAFGAPELFELGGSLRTFENFEIGDSNKVAVALARRVAEDPGHGDIILFHGPNGVGKTHLLESIAHGLRNSACKRRIVILTAQRFLNEFQAALRERDTGPFKAALRSADVLLIDDLHLICGKPATQDEFFQTVDDLLARGKNVVCTADVSSENLQGLSPRMRGVLQGGYAARLHEPDFTLRRAIAKRKASELNARKGGFDLPEEAFDCIAARVVGTGRAVEGAVKQVFAASALIGQEATMEVVLEAVDGTWRAPEKKVPVDTIKRRVAAHFDLSLEDLISQRRHRAVARPRQIAMYFCKRLTSRSFPDIGQRFGGRDHTTVMHAVKRIEELALTDPTFAGELQEIGRKITD